MGGIGAKILVSMDKAICKATTGRGVSGQGGQRAGSANIYPTEQPSLLLLSRVDFTNYLC